MLLTFFRLAAARQQRAFSSFAGGAAPETLKAKLAERGYVKGTRILDDVTVESLRSRLPLLFRGEFETGVYPDEMHWREGISRDDAPREVRGRINFSAV